MSIYSKIKEAKDKNLSELFLDGNQLTKLPDGIGELENLKELYLWNNQLTELPDTVGEFIKLEVIGLGNKVINGSSGSNS